MKTDYTKLDGPEFLYAVNDDAAKWAAAFCQHFPESGIDEGTMIGWFANAIEHSSDIRAGRVLSGEHAQWLVDNGIRPDGSRVDEKGQ